jgi:pantothenate kinase
MLGLLKNPKQAVMNVVGTNANPILKNLVEMAQKGDYQGVENTVRNIYKEQGKDFDQELQQFKQLFK